jgi:hypothetical protein
MRVVVALAVLLFAVPASAQSAPGLMPASALPRNEIKHKEPHDPGNAVARSLAVTVGGYLVFFAGAGSGNGLLLGGGLVGVLAGPATGYWYGSDDVGGIGLVARGTGLIALLIGLDDLEYGEWIECDSFSDPSCADEEARADAKAQRGEYLIYGGLGLIAASSIYDFINVYYATESWNEHNVMLAPVVSSTSTGLALTGRW